MHDPWSPLFTTSALSERLSQLHERLLETVPCVDRIACAIYDRGEDLLKTYVNSTRHGQALSGYQIKLSNSRSLSHLAKSGEWRVLDDIPEMIKGDSTHSQWLLAQGYHASFTLPLYDNGTFFGMLFFDSRQPAAFTPVVQRDLALYSNLINMTLSTEMAAVRSIIATAQVAKDFADLRDFETGAHLERMARISRLIAKGIAASHGLSDEFVEHLFLFAPLHDIGKIGVPDKILLKPGKLDDEERRVMQTHVDKGIQIIDKIIGDFGLQQLADSAVMKNIVRCHHEFLDGTGYPAGIKGDAIPIEARIVTVADILDALTSSRPYKAAWSVEQALLELDRMVGAGQLDADCVAAVHGQSEEVASIIQRYQDNLPAPDTPLPQA